MNNSPYINTFVIDQPLVCITEFIENKIKHYGLSIRYYSSHNNVFASGKYKDNQGVFKSIPFTEFVAVVKYEDFDPRGDLIKIIETYKVT